MRRFLKMAVCFCSAIMLIACQKEESSSNKLAKQEVVADDVKLSLNQDWDKVSEKMGEPLHYTESKSCLYDGFDKTYEFEKVTIITYPTDAGEKINSILISASDVSNGLGIQLGDSTDKLTEVMGEPDNTTDTFYLYEQSEYGFAFYIDDSKIKEIEIYLVTE